MIRSKPHRDIRGYTRISPAGVPSAAPLAHAGYANLTGNCWVAAEDGCPAGRMVAVARVNEGEGGAEPGCACCRGLKRQVFKC